MKLLPDKKESFTAYLCRLKSALLRRIFPSLRRRFELELLVGPTGCWKQLQDYQLECLKAAGLQPHHSLLDIGCGPLAGGQKFIEYLKPGAYVGVDIRTEPLTNAYMQIAECGLVEKNPVLVLSETFGRDELKGRSFEYVWVSQMTYHLSDDQTERLFESVTTLLKPNGSFCCDVLIERGDITDQSHWQGFPFHIRPLDFFEQMGNRHGYDLTCLGKLAQFGYPENVGLKNNLLLRFVRNSLD